MENGGVHPAQLNEIRACCSIARDTLKYDAVRCPWLSHAGIARKFCIYLTLCRGSGLLFVVDDDDDVEKIFVLELFPLM